MTPEVSVVIPCHNGADLVRETILEVLALADDAGVGVEVIVVDDGSNDSTREVVDALPVLAVSQDRAGVAAARNRGLAFARAPVIGMLDVDDRWTSAVFDALLPVLRSDDGPMIVQGRVRDLWPDEGLGPPYEGLNIGSALFTASTFASVGPFDESLPRLEDYEWFVRAYDRRVQKHRLSQPVLHYRRRSDGLSASAPHPDTLLPRVHRTILRRRQSEEHLLCPRGFPSAASYLGVVPPEAERRPRAPTVTLRPLSTTSIESHGTVRAFACVRDERPRLPAMLAHHRRLGIRSFFVVDNGSTDGSVEFLLAQPDVHLWSTEESFAAARCGTDWILDLIDRYGSEGWNLVIDADELFVYLGYEHVPIDELCSRLDTEGAKAMLAVIIDLYSDRAIADTSYDPGTDPLDVCPWFDRRPWGLDRATFFHHTSHRSFFGGPRDRAFGAPTGADPATYYTQSKVPLFHGGRALQPSQNFHWMDSAHLSTARAGILHWKYIASFPDRVRVEAARGEHWDEASQYGRYVAGLDAVSDLSLYDRELSIRFVDSDQLGRLGILVDHG